MRILIENAERREFLTKNGQWTRKPEEATAFAATSSALATARGEPIRNFNIVGYINHTKQFVNLDHGMGSLEPIAPTVAENP